MFCCIFLGISCDLYQLRETAHILANVANTSGANIAFCSKGRGYKSPEHPRSNTPYLHKQKLHPSFLDYILSAYTICLVSFRYLQLFMKNAQNRSIRKRQILNTVLGLKMAQRVSSFLN